MTSERKIVANRRNSGRSCGPRTAAGKKKASRNAVRHGLAALVHRRQPVPSAEIEQLANAICGGEQDPLLREQATAIAETALVLQAVQAQKNALIERLKDREAIALASGDDRLIRADARHLRSKLALEDISALSAEVMWRYKNRFPRALKRDMIQPNGCFIGDFVPLQLKLLDEYAEAYESMEEAYNTRSRRLGQASELLKARERNDRQAVLEALPDLVRLDRYERRAWARQKRAIRKFMRIKSARELGNCGTA
jgi:uncharacterized coiled-coil protein SlyX